MNIAPTVEKLKEFSTASFNSTRNAVEWLGRQVNVITNQYVIPGSKVAYAVALTNFRIFHLFAQANIGLALVISGLSLVAALGALEMSHNKDALPFTSVLWKTIGLAAFLFAAGATGATLSALATV